MHHISVTWHFRRCKLFFFWILSVRRTIGCHFHENRCYFIFSTLYNLNIYLWPLKPHNFKSMCRISKIITFLESLRQAGWFDLFESYIQALLIFNPLITLWGNFDAPYLKLLNDASVALACFYVRTCRIATCWIAPYYLKITLYSNNDTRGRCKYLTRAQRRQVKPD